MPAITTKAQATRASNKIADLLWAAHRADRITFEQADSLASLCVDLVFDHGMTPAAAVEAVVSSTVRA